MSSSAFDTMREWILTQKKNIVSKSTSAPDLMHPDNIHSTSRRALYGSLPFVAAFGMQHRENQIRRVLSTLSTSTLESMEMQESEARHDPPAP